jgi:DNA helicase-2/ATP-dependent DNA helicase PcrA
VLDRTDYLNQLKKEDSPEAQSRIENLEELDNALSQFVKERGSEATLQSYLEEMSLLSDLDQMKEEVPAVTLMTLHVSKGLEFPYVFIVGCEENLFPSARSSDDEGNENVEEERRLAYVGMTRARQKLFMTYARKRRVWGQEQMNAPSRFLDEVPDEFKKIESAIEMPRFAHRSMQNANARSSSFGDSRSSGAHDFDSQSFPEEAFENDSWSSQAKNLSSSREYAPGMKVRHPTFGAGSIYSTEGDGDQLKVSVIFRDNTVKKFIAKYARLEKI